MAQPTQSNSIFLVALSLVFFSILYLTISPSVAGGDSGELLAEGCSLGTAHPPGYPLFTIMIYIIETVYTYIYSSSSSINNNFLLNYVPMYYGDYNIAYIANISSAIFTIIAGYFMCQSILLIHMIMFPNSFNSSRKQQLVLVGLYGASIYCFGMFSFSHSIWQYATTSEVFPMNTMFASLLVYLVLLFAKDRSVAIAYLGAFVCGLALCNQHTILLYEIPLILWVLYLLLHHPSQHNPSHHHHHHHHQQQQQQQKKQQQDSSTSNKTSLLDNNNKWIQLLGLSLCFGIGLLPYLYLPLASIHHPTPGSWGDVTTWGGFVHHILRKDYGTFQLYSGNDKHSGMSGTSGTSGSMSGTSGSMSNIMNGILLGIDISGLIRLGKNSITRTRLYLIDFSTAQGNAIAVVLVMIALMEIVRVSFLSMITGITRRSGDNSSNNNSVSSSNSSNNSSNSSSNSSNNSSNNNIIQQQQKQQHYESPAIFTPFILILTQCFYLLLFHSLSNLPIEGDQNQLFYGIHQRFWMQPNVLMFIWSGYGFLRVVNIGYDILDYMWLGGMKRVNEVRVNDKLINDGDDDDDDDNSSSNSHHNNNNNSSNNNNINNSNNRSKNSNNSKNTDNNNSNNDNNHHKTQSSYIQSILNLLTIIISTCLIYQQYITNIHLSDQKQAFYFHHYASAILLPLPRNSILLINADQKWSSIRYLQECEHVRKDVIAINLSMMTYSSWFHSKQKVYSSLVTSSSSSSSSNDNDTNDDDNNNDDLQFKQQQQQQQKKSKKKKKNHQHSINQSIIFPGQYQAPPNTLPIYKKQAYTLLQFIDVNIHQFKFFFVGNSLTQINYPDPEISKKYESLNIGLSVQFVPYKNLPNGTAYQELIDKKWRQILNIFKKPLPYPSSSSSSSSRNSSYNDISIVPEWFLPSEDKYDESTWEWTIRRDIYDRLIDTAALSLERGIDIAHKDPAPLVYALYLLESILYLESRFVSSRAPVPASLLKNTGLAHVHLIQNKLLPYQINSTWLLYHPAITAAAATTAAATTTAVSSTNSITSSESSSSSSSSSSRNYDIFQTTEAIGWPTAENVNKWKDWSTNRFITCWGTFLSRSDAIADPQYSTIKSLYDTATGAINTKQNFTNVDKAKERRYKQQQEKKKKKKIKSKFVWGKI